jgi:hypothetical protein
MLSEQHLGRFDDGEPGRLAALPAAPILISHANILEREAKLSQARRRFGSKALVACREKEAQTGLDTAAVLHACATFTSISAAITAWQTRIMERDVNARTTITPRYPTFQLKDIEPRWSRNGEMAHSYNAAAMVP